MNSKTQFRQPAIPRVVTAREPSGGKEGEGGWRRREGGAEGAPSWPGRKAEEEITGLSPFVIKSLGPVNKNVTKSLLVILYFDLHAINSYVIYRVNRT